MIKPVSEKLTNGHASPPQLIISAIHVQRIFETQSVDSSLLARDVHDTRNRKTSGRNSSLAD